jgi:predicted RNA-binding Zn-ribbon protein involved in translation (DUF1610 family)
VTVEHQLQVCTSVGVAGLRHGPRAEKFSRPIKHVFLCGACGIIVLRTEQDRAFRDFVIICDNCGAINTDISHI